MGDGFPAEAFIAICIFVASAAGFVGFTQLGQYARLRRLADLYIAELYQQEIREHLVPLVQQWVNSPMEAGLRLEPPADEVIDWLEAHIQEALNRCLPSFEKCALIRQRLRFLRAFEARFKLLLVALAALVILLGLFSLIYTSWLQQVACCTICATLVVGLAGYVVHAVYGGGLEATISSE